MNRLMKLALTCTVALGALAMVSCDNSGGDPPQYTVTVTNDGNGAAAADKTKAGAGATVTLTATPNEGFVFGKWTVRSGGATLSPGVTTSPATFTMPEGNVSVEAEFVEAAAEPEVEIPDESELTQTAFADEDTTGGFTFVAKAAWTVSVEETTSAPVTRSVTRADGVSWLRLLLDGEETYSGSAGTVDMTIELDPNYTGATRSASIVITSGSTDIEIGVTQAGTTEAGEVPEDPNPRPGEPDADYFGTWIVMGTGEYEGIWESATIDGDRIVYKSGTDGDVYTLENLAWTAVNLPEDDTNGDGVIDGNDDTGYSAGYKITGTLVANPAGRNIAKAEGTGYASVGEQAADWWYIRAADKGALMRAMWAEPTPGSYHSSITGPFVRHTGELPPPTPDPKLMSRIVEYYEGFADYTNEFVYDGQDRLTEIVLTVEDRKGSTAITYPDANTIVMTGPMYEDEGGSIVLELNDNGNVISISNGAGDRVIETYVYDSGGYLHKYECGTSLDDNGTIHTGISTCIFTWENGNIKTVVNNAIFASAPEYGFENVTTFEYGALLNKPCGMDLGYIFYETGSNIMPRGWLGKSPVNMATKKTERSTSTTDGDVTHNESVTTYRYETDGRGYVTELFSQTDGESESLDFVFSYK